MRNFIGCVAEITHPCSTQYQNSPPTASFVSEAQDKASVEDSSYQEESIFQQSEQADQKFDSEQCQTWEDNSRTEYEHVKPRPRPRTKLRFDTEASVYLIPHFHEYPRWDHHAMWYSRNEFLCMVERNYDEQAHEQLLEEENGVSSPEPMHSQVEQIEQEQEPLKRPPSIAELQNSATSLPIRRPSVGLRHLPVGAILSESPRASTEHPLGTPRMLLARKDVNAQRKQYLSRLGL